MSEAVKTHQPCDDCGSSDALAIYTDHTFCFSCQKTRKLSCDETTGEVRRHPASSEFVSGKPRALAKRGITEETCRHWSYIVGDFHGRTVQVAQYLDDNRRVVAQKVRLPDKQFPWIGPRRDFKGLYGQWLWRDGGKVVVITEGELDALSVSQVQNNKWPVVSLPDGAGNAPKAIKEALPWLSKFEKIVLWFDNDEAGREAVDKVKLLLPPGRCYITWAPEGYKDASDLLQAGKDKIIIDCVWGAKQWVPEVLISGNAIIDRLKARPAVTSYPYPEILPKLNHMTGGGIRLGELDTWTSGSGMGKTTLIKMLQNHYFHTTDFCQALIHLEEPLEDTGDDLIAYEVGKRFTVDDPGFKDTKEYLDTAEKLFLSKNSEGNYKFVLYDAFGSVEDDTLYGIIRYLRMACGIRVFWLDHLSILVSDMDQDGDERRKIDALMSKLKNLTVELDIYIGLISHLKKPVGTSQGKTFETGLVPTLDDLRGSAGIKQLSNGVFALSRNQQHPNPLARNTSAITVLKCRKTGRTGPADYVLFDENTGRFVKGVDPDSYSDMENSDGPSEY